MQAMNYFGQDGARLKWESPKPGCAVNFLDLNIKVNQDTLLMTSTLQKLTKLYLFRAPASVQPRPNMLNGRLIYGTLHQVFWQRLACMFPLFMSST
jgi:hypothetical protein